jgi:NitT/TauT family transport system substrate-binding protein
MPEMVKRAARRWLLVAAALAALALGNAPGHADSVKIGVLKATGSGPAFVAQDKGYFTAEGLSAELVFFDSAQPIAVAVASGDVDFGYTGLTGGFYGLASQGVLRIVGGGAHEVAGFHYQPYLASNRAWDAGLRSVKDIPGHSFALSQIGSPTHYALGMLAAKYGFDIKSVRLLPLQSIPNMVSALVGGQADSGMVPGNVGNPMVESGKAKLLAYAGQETPYQLAVLFASAKTTDERHDVVERVLRAMVKASRDYHDAFTGPNEVRADGAAAGDILAVIAKNTGQTPDQVRSGISYIDPAQRLDIADVLRQVAWYRAQGLVKGPVEAGAMIDTRYVVALPGG